MPATDQGVSLDRYMLVPRTLTFITHGEKVLLLKGAETKRLWAGLYNGIGGHIEQGEDVFSAAKRELSEEAGLTISDLWLCGIVTVDTQTNPGVGIFIFRGECPESVTVVSTEGILEWVQVSSINNLPLVPDLPLLLPRILEHKPGKPPFFAHSWYDKSGDLFIKYR
jgi:8-oxo-dGTP diphosphatase